MSLSNDHVTAAQLGTFATGLEAKTEERYAKNSTVNAMIGSDAGKSVRTIANEEIAAQLIPENAREALDTLQEIAAWIQSHPAEASALNLKLTLGTHAVPKFVQATGTYVDGTTYYTDATGATEVDSSGFVAGTTDVSSYYVQDGTETVQYATVAEFVNAIAAGKVDKDGAKVLSDNNYTTAEKEKLASLNPCDDSEITEILNGMYTS